MRIKILQNTFVKIVSTGTLVMFLFLGITSIGSTVSYYRDNEKSLNNTLNTKSLTFDVLIDGQDEVQVDLTSGEVALTPVVTVDADGFPIQYWVSAQVVGGDIALCEAIDLVGTFPFPYNNRLSLLQTSTTTTTGAWTNEFSIFGDRTQYENKFCIVDLIYRGKMLGSNNGGGYTDTQTVRITFNVTEQLQQKVQFLPEVHSDIEVDLQQGIEVIDESRTQSSTDEEINESIAVEDVVPEKVDIPEATNNVELPNAVLKAVE